MYYALNADLYKGGHGQGHFKGDPYRGPTDRGTDLGEGQASPGQGFGEDIPNVNGLPGTGPGQGFGEDRPNVDGTPGIGQELPGQGFGIGPNVEGPSDIPEQPFNGQPQGDDYGGVNVADPQEKPLIRGLETPLQEPGYGQNVPEQGPEFSGQRGPGYGQDGPDQRPGFSGQDGGPGFSGQDVPQTGPEFRGQDIPQQGPGFGPGDSEQGPGYAANPQQGIGYGQRGPAIPEDNIGQGNNGGSDIQGGQGTDYGATRGDWGQDNGGKRNWGGQEKRGSTDGNWRGGGTNGNGVKGGWKSPDGSARGRKARSWGTHGLDKRWGSESENWISLEEAAEPEAFKIERDSDDNSNERRYVALFEDEPRAEDWESERSTNPGGRMEGVHRKNNEDGNDIWSSASRNEENDNDVPKLRKWRADPRNDVGVEKIAIDKEDARSDTWLSSEKESGDIPKSRNWRTVDGPQKEIEFKNILKEDDGRSGVWLSSESESSDTVPKSRVWRTVEDNPKELEKSDNKNWWLESLGGEEHKPKGRFVRDAPHLFGGWRTLNNQFGHLNKIPYRRTWNR